MSKVFLYLYPIKEFASKFTLYQDIDDSKLSEDLIKTKYEPFKALNETIDKRYRKKGYKIVYVIYPDKEIYGVKLEENDTIIKTNITFNEVIKNHTYPSEEEIIKQIGDISKLVVAGYHSTDCVRRTSEVALEKGIDVLVDLDLTDLFFGLYKNREYFDKEIYDASKLRNYMINKRGEEYKELMTRIIDETYKSPVYNFNGDIHINEVTK